MNKYKIFINSLLVISVFVINTRLFSQQPAYPLYAPYFGASHTFTDNDVKALAKNFTFFYGQSLTKEQIENVKKTNNKTKIISYVGGWTVNMKEAEQKLRMHILYYPSAKLVEPINATDTIIKVEKIYGDSLCMLSSTTVGNYSKNNSEYVVWIRIGNELMRVDSINYVTNIIKISRGFDGTLAIAHSVNELVFSVAYGSAPKNPSEWERQNNKELSYHYDPNFTDRFDIIRQRLFKYVEIGGDGVWIDILMDGTLDPQDAYGKRLPRFNVNDTSYHGYWNFATNNYFKTDDYRLLNEKGINYIQQAYKAKYGKLPVIYGNNTMASRANEGRGGHRLYLYPTTAKPIPLNGMCIEDFMGGYNKVEWEKYARNSEVVAPTKACYPCSVDYKNWKDNIQFFMRLAQDGRASTPLIINAGMKTAVFEKLDTKSRHDWEQWAYASYLLGVEVINGKCATSLGIPMFYYDGSNRHVGLDSMYYLKIGRPLQTAKPANFDSYKVKETDVYKRKFSNGLVLVNPSDKVEKIVLNQKYFDNDTNQYISEIAIPAKSGKILLSKK